MERDPRAHLADILEASRNIQAFTAGRDRDDYVSDLMLRSAVERQFEIVGEALNRLSREDPTVAARIPDVSRIVGFRNILVHGYDIVDDESVWTAITHDVPTLVSHVASLLAELEA